VRKGHLPGQDLLTVLWVYDLFLLVIPGLGHSCRGFSKLRPSKIKVTQGEILKGLKRISVRLAEESEALMPVSHAIGLTCLSCFLHEMLYWQFAHMKYD
jgi:hypothetical protein